MRKNAPIRQTREGFGAQGRRKSNVADPKSTLNAGAPRHRQKEIHGLRRAIGKAALYKMREVGAKNANVITGMWIMDAGYD